MKTLRTTISELPESPMAEEIWRFVCPSCRGSLRRKDDVWECREESFTFRTVEGIPDFVIPARRGRVDEFLGVYQDVRRIEEWGDGSPAFILSLPFEDRTRKHTGNWHVRSRTYESFVKDLSQGVTRSARVLDLGAGNCWLSVRLSTLGYRVTAVDVNLDERDGLRAASSVSPEIRSIDLVRAEFDHLPFAPTSFDVIVFNASLHYNRDPIQTLHTISTLLTRGGSIYILDSPVYNDEKDGNAMIRERRNEIGRLVGREIPEELGGSFLTHELLRQLGAEYVVQTLHPNYGFRWKIRPVIASVFRRRRPADFMITRLTPRTAGAA